MVNQQYRAGLASLGTNLAQGLRGGMLGDDLCSALVLAPMTEGASSLSPSSPISLCQTASSSCSPQPPCALAAPGFSMAFFTFHALT